MAAEFFVNPKLVENPQTNVLVHGRWIEGSGILPLSRFSDERGSFMEIYRKNWDMPIDLAQMSLVHSLPGTLRGMHLHRRHEESFCVVSGSAYVGLRDLRPGSPTEGQSLMVHLKGSEPSVLYFPRGVVHGWLFPEETLHIQGVSEDYGNYGHDDNPGCHWSDPALAIPWPFVPTLVADRAKNFGSLEKLVEWMKS